MRLIVLLLLSCLTACGGSPSRPPRSSGSASAATRSHTATPTAPRTGPLTTGPNVRPGEKPPVFPKEASEHDTIGALVFAQYYFRAFDWGLATNDSYLLKQISAPACTACTRAVTAIDDAARKGSYLDGGRITIQSFGIASGHFKYRSEYVVRVVTTQGSQVAHAQNGVVTGRSVESKDVALVFVTWRSDKWQVQEVGAP